MLSYSYRPRTMTSTTSSVPPQKPEPRQGRQERGRECENRILETINEDVVLLDYLIGVVLVDNNYVFVHYRPTENHKKCAGLKIDPVAQINAFVQTLRNKSISIEISLNTLMPSTKKSLLIRVSLADLRELSLEPLWMIKGRARLYSKDQSVTVTIDDASVGPCVLDRRSLLLISEPHKNRMGELLALTKEAIVKPDNSDVVCDREEDTGAVRREQRSEKKRGDTHERETRKGDDGEEEAGGAACTPKRKRTSGNFERIRRRSGPREGKERQVTRPVLPQKFNRTAWNDRRRTPKRVAKKTHRAKLVRRTGAPDKPKFGAGEPADVPTSVSSTRDRRTPSVGEGARTCENAAIPAASPTDCRTAASGNVDLSEHSVAAAVDSRVSDPESTSAADVTPGQVLRVAQQRMTVTPTKQAPLVANGDGNKSRCSLM